MFVKVRRLISGILLTCLLLAITSMAFAQDVAEPNKASTDDWMARMPLIIVVIVFVIGVDLVFIRMGRNWRQRVAAEEAAEAANQ